MRHFIEPYSGIVCLIQNKTKGVAIYTKILGIKVKGGQMTNVDMDMILLVSQIGYLNHIWLGYQQFDQLWLVIPFSIDNDCALDGF